MKNKKGFTLIELLAVIIILAVIALIATPIVLNVVENARISANKDSVYGLLDSAKLYYAESLLDENKTLSGNILDKINITGRKPDSGFIYINEVGEVNISVMYDKICYMKDYEETDLRVKKVSKSSECNIESTIVIKVLSEKVSDKVKIEITYGDLSVKQYKIGNGSWNNYEGEFEVTSYDYVENNNLVDGKAIIYAKGIDELGNESTKEKEITLLDIDIPDKPIIKLSNGYPLLTATKIENGDITTITYDSRSDIKNYYKIDDGEWIEYKEGINITGSEIYAKSVKETGLEVITSEKINDSEITDAITKEAYDGDLSTAVSGGGNFGFHYMYIDGSIWNKRVRIITSSWTDSYCYGHIVIYDSGNNVLLEETNTTGYNNRIITIPINSYKLGYVGQVNHGLYEIQLVDEIPPVVNASVFDNKASIVLTDNTGLSAYSITQTNTEPTEWIEIESTKIKNIILDNLNLGTYYVWAKDLDDNISRVSFIVKLNNKCINDCETNFDYTGTEQTYTALKSGYYRLETWGAQGGDAVPYDSSYKIFIGGYGGYSKGEVYLNKGDVLYINVGEHGKTIQGNDNSTISASYNGGGLASRTDGYGTYSDSRGNGGGATHISKISGLLSTLYNKQEFILIVSGAGGGAINYNNSNYYTAEATGGSAGGYIGSNSTDLVRLESGHSLNVSSQAGKGGAQTGLNNMFGLGLSPTTIASSGGGSGYYGGTAGYYGGGGGSSYIGNALLGNKVMYCYNCIESNDEKTKTVSTTNVSSSPVSNYAKMGNGYAKITYLGY
mgnify:CR=1 FL=1